MPRQSTTHAPSILLANIPEGQFSTHLQVILFLNNPSGHRSKQVLFPSKAYLLFVQLNVQVFVFESAYVNGLEGQPAEQVRVKLFAKRGVGQEGRHSLL